jgi:hypothetical protein
MSFPAKEKSLKVKDRKEKPITFLEQYQSKPESA